MAMLVITSMIFHYKHGIIMNYEYILHIHYTSENIIVSTTSHYYLLIVVLTTLNMYIYIYMYELILWTIIMN